MSMERKIFESMVETSRSLAEEDKHDSTDEVIMWLDDHIRSLEGSGSPGTNVIVAMEAAIDEFQNLNEYTFVHQRNTIPPNSGVIRLLQAALDQHKDNAKK